MSADSKFVPDPSWPTIVELAIELWGQPTDWSHDRNEARFGSKGSKSVRLREMVWKDHESGDGGGYVEMWRLARRGTPLPPRETGRPKPKLSNGPGGKVPPWENIGTIYHYHAADGGLILDVIRTITGTPRFLQRAPDAGSRSGWKWSVKHIPGHDCLLYRLPGLRASDDATVWITEGEKDADRLHDEGLIATTNIGGAGKWRDEYAEEFHGKHCVVLQDNDQAGRDHCDTVACSLSGIAASVKVLALPGLPPKGDVSDWLDDNGRIEDLERLAGEAQEYQKQTPAPDPVSHELPQIPWIDERLSDWANRDLPPRNWVVPDWIPRGQVTGLYGVGGIHKTNLLIQLLLAKSRGLMFLEYVLEAGPVYGLFCEDTREEIVRRAIRIAKDVWDFDSLAYFPDFHFASLVGVQGKEFATFNNGIMQHPPMPALLRLDETIVAIGATLVTLDTLPHFFGGNEVVRREVTQFVTQLDGISIERDCGLLFTAHPSARGKQTGSLDSGSTGWEGSVRARITLRDPGPEDGEEPDERTPDIPSDRRILKRAKSNYAKAGEEIELVVRDGVFFVAGTAETPGKPPKTAGPERDAACDAKFLELLAAVAKQGSYVNDTHNSRDHYAPKVFSRRPDGREFKIAEYQRAIERLYYAERLRLVEFGPPSKSLTQFIDTQTAGPPARAPLPTQAEIDAACVDYLKMDEAQREFGRRLFAKKLGIRVKAFEKLAKAAPRPVETVGNGGNPPENGASDE